jgi:hypothetical protein
MKTPAVARRIQSAREPPKPKSDTQMAQRKPIEQGVGTKLSAPDTDKRGDDG